MIDPTSTTAQNADVDLGFAGLTTPVGGHIGHFYRHREQMVDLMTGYLVAGLDGNDTDAVVGPPETHEEIRTELESRGVNVDTHVRSGSLLFVEGESCVDAMDASFREVMDRSMLAERRLVRVAADMVWSFTKLPCIHELAHWEAFYDLHLAPQFPIVALCHYDLTRFSGDVIFDALKTHALCIVDETIHKNPFHESPTAFLEELRTREEAHAQ